MPNDEADGLTTSIVQIVGPTDSWTLQRLAKRLAAKLPYATFSPWEPDRSAPPGIAYYVNYALYHGPTSFVDVGFFTHRDDEQDFLGRARSMDHCVCMSKIYADWLRAQGIEKVTHIPMGCDFYRYRARLVLGVVGLLDHPRKGKHIVEQGFRFGMMSEADIPSSLPRAGRVVRMSARTATDRACHRVAARS